MYAELVPIPLNTSSFFSLIDFSGVVAGAVGGALEAKQNRTYEFDFVGVLGLGCISALGGGITRDILLEHGPPLAFTDVRYLLLAFGGALIGLICGATLGSQLTKPLVWVDAAALGFFAVAGSTRALTAGLSFLPALILGVVTAVGGGSLRDVFSGRSPKVFERGELYAVVAAFASLVFLISDRLSGNAALSTSFGLVAGFLFRALALRFAWRTKAAR
jgi:uncharacterized membrane protein YeiH